MAIVRHVKTTHSKEKEDKLNYPAKLPFIPWREVTDHRSECSAWRRRSAGHLRLDGNNFSVLVRRFRRESVECRAPW